MHFFILFLYIYIHRYFIFFLDHLGTSCRQDTCPLNVQCIFPRNKGILLHDHNMSNKNRTFKINTILLSNPQPLVKFCQIIPPNNYFFTVQPPVKDTHCILLSLSLASFNLEQFQPFSSFHNLNIFQEYRLLFC